MASSGSSSGDRLYFGRMFCILSFAFLSFITAPSLAASGGWAATYGGVGSDLAYSIEQTGDGGYVVAGETRSFGAGEDDILVLKLRPNGTVKWQKTYGGDGSDLARSIQQTSDGGYIVAGRTASFGVGSEEIPDLWVLKLEPNGAVEWQKTYGGGDSDVARYIQQTSDGGYIAAGGTASFGAGSEEIPDLWVLKLEPNGAVEWQKTYGGFGKDVAESVQQTGDGGYVVAGYTTSFSTGDADLWVLKLGPYGTVEWQKNYGRGDSDQAESIRQSSDGGYVVVGWTWSFGAEGQDLWVLKLEPDGTVEWQKTYRGGGIDGAVSVQQTGDEGYIVAGGTGAFNIGNEVTLDIWVLKLTPDGTVEWQKTYGGGGMDVARSIRQTSDGGYIVAGSTESFGVGKEDIWVLKLEPDGSIDPFCDFLGDTNTSGIDNNALILDTSVIVRDSNASPQGSSATVRDTNVSANIICPSTAVE